MCHSASPRLHLGVNEAQSRDLEYNLMGWLRLFDTLDFCQHLLTRYPMCVNAVNASCVTRTHGI